MPRDAFSNYSLPAGNPIVTGTIIASSWANTTLSDIATALTQSLSTDGSSAAVSLSGKSMSGGTYASPTVTGIQNLVGGKIQFPAVQAASSNANTLDDYEEGTFTPSLSFGSPGNLGTGYSVRIGQYTKVGNKISFKIHMLTSSFNYSTSAGGLVVNGLPFSSSSGTTAITIGALNGVLAAGRTMSLATLDGTQISFSLINVAANSGGPVSTADVPSGTQKLVILSGTYLQA